MERIPKQIKPTYEVWMVAAAILASERDPLHYEPLTDQILKLGITSLGKDGKTPKQTVGAMMRKKADIFYSFGSGSYSLVNPTEIRQKESIRAIQIELMNCFRNRYTICPVCDFIHRK